MSATPIETVATPAPDLGELQEEFSFARRDLITTAVVVVAVAIWVPLVFYLKNPAILAPENSWDWVMAVGSIGLTLAVVVGGAVILLRIHHRRHLRVLVYEKGFAVGRPDEVFSCRWDEVEATQELFGDPRDRRNRECTELYGLTVRCRGQRQWTLNRMDECLKDSNRLAELIQERAARSMLSQSLAELYKGRSLECGVAQLTFLGITVPNATFPWTELKRVTLHRHGLKFRRRGLWSENATLGPRDLVNKHLLLAVADAMCRGRR